jgi:hypothetical protein
LMRLGRVMSALRCMIPDRATSRIMRIPVK